LLKSFFFIPSNNEKFIRKVNSIDADFFVFDLEDSISNYEIKSSLDKLKKIKLNDNHYARLRFGSFKKNNSESIILSHLINLGFKKFLVPKISDLDELKKMKSYLEAHIQYEFEKYQFILLVENPRCLINLKTLINGKMINITGVTLGSHDYSSSIGMKHISQYLSYARNYVLTIAKAYELMAIDIASMKIESRNEFSNECIDAFNMGYDAKFVLHPQQLELLKKTKYFDNKEIKNALDVYKKIESIDFDKFSVVKLNGELYEKAHIKRIKKIVEWYRAIEN